MNESEIRKHLASARRAARAALDAFKAEPEPEPEVAEEPTEPDPDDEFAKAEAEIVATLKANFEEYLDHIETDATTQRHAMSEELLAMGRERMLALGLDLGDDTIHRTVMMVLFLLEQEFILRGMLGPLLLIHNIGGQSGIARIQMTEAQDLPDPSHVVDPPHGH